ncbi:MAG TPA: hypothetical protein VLK33_15610 [Terriglobales bacterium]|nr:hypothetical protein [Terriglobales bacterium]
MRFRIILPLLSVTLGVAMFYWGDAQARKSIAVGKGAPEGIPDVAATARYVHYALNAPAWAIAISRTDRLWSPSEYWSGRDLYYFLVVVVMWFLIGQKLDQRFSLANRMGASGRTHRYQMLGGTFLFLYGIFVSYRVVPAWSWTGLKFWAAGLLRLDHGWWFGVIGLSWSLALVASGLNSLFEHKGATAI